MTTTPKLLATSFELSAKFANPYNCYACSGPCTACQQPCTLPCGIPPLSSPVALNISATQQLDAIQSIGTRASLKQKI